MAYTVRANQFSLKVLDAIGAAYLAGLFDGEGSLYLVARKGQDRKSHQFHPSMTLGNTNLSLLESLVEMTENGSIRVNKKDDHPNHKQVYSWELGPSQIRHILPQIMPYLRSKCRQAELMMEFFDLQQQADRGPRGWHLVDPAIIQRILAVYEELRTLNRRGLKPVEALGFSVGEGKPRKRTCDEEGCENRRYYGQSYCYQHWLQRRTPEAKVCEECGMSFDAILPHRRFCSDRCQWRNAARRRKEK